MLPSLVSSNPLVSIIVPVFNVEKYLSNCIDSILAQTYTNFELILVDDGSQDESWQICKEYFAKDRRVKIFQKENGGVTLARKKGWTESNGSWIVFVDSDDTITADCLNILLSKALDNNCEIVKGCMQSTGSGRKWLHKKTGIMDRTEYLESLFKKQTFAYLCASIYKSELIKESTFQIDKSIKIGEDVLTCIELGLRVKKAMNLDAIIYHYHDNDTSVMNSKIMHPSYIERSFNVATDLLSQAEDLSHNLIITRKKDLHLNLVRAFFSPFIPFDAKYYLHLKNLLKRNLIAKSKGKDRIFVFAMRNDIIARLIKESYHWAFLLKNRIKGQPTNAREILY